MNNERHIQVHRSDTRERAAMGESFCPSEATREQVFKALPAIANPVDKFDVAKVCIRIEGPSAASFDTSLRRNAVDKPLDEADIEQTIEG